MFYPHPALSGAPAVLVFMVAASEVLALASNVPVNYRRVSYFSVACLVVVAPFTYFTGYFAAAEASQAFLVSQEVIAEHQSYAKLLMLSLVPLFLFSIIRPRETKLGVLNILFFVFLLTTTLLVFITSNHGGDLVFEHGAGVRAGVQSGVRAEAKPEAPGETPTAVTSER